MPTYRRTVAACVIGALLASACPVVAQHVTLEAKDTPLKDVLAELRRQTRCEFEIIGALKQDDQPRPVTVSFADTPFKRALEEICRQAGCWFGRPSEKRFWIGEGTPPPDTVPSADVDGIVVRVKAVQLSSRVAFYDDHSTSAAPPPESPPHLTIELGIDAPDDAAGARLYGLSGLKVEDDAGRAMAGPGRGQPTDLMPLHPNMSDPSAYDMMVAATCPAADARTISLSGELVLFEECDRVEVSIPWGEAEKTHGSEGLEVTVQSFEDAGDQLTVTASVKVPPPPELGLGLALGPQRLKPDAWLEWENDFANLRGITASAGAQTLTFRRPADAEGPPQRLVYTAFVKANPDLKLPFEIKGIRLPQMPTGTQATATPAEEAAKPHPYWAEDAMSGSVEFDVMVDDQFVPGPVSIPIDARIRNEDGTFSERAAWEEEIDEDGHVTIRNLKPGFYALSLRASGMGHLGTFELQERFERMFGIDAEDYIWVNEFTQAQTDIGTSTQLDPVRFVPSVKLIRPTDGDVLPKDNLVFSWEAHDGASAYQVGLAVKPTPEHSDTVWLSDPVEGTQLRYNPATGARLGPPGSLDLDPEKQYRWWVYALDTQGKRISYGPCHGTFTVE
jgi:hypothetical protein